MATVLRDWSYQYPWLYQTIAKTTALIVGGNARLRQLPWAGVSINLEDPVLDLCCGRGEVTRFLVQQSHHVTGLDASPKALAKAREDVPEATYVEAFAQQMPFEDGSFQIVHTSLALHELTPSVRTQTLQEVIRVLKAGGTFLLIDFHPPTVPILWPGLALFLWLFETETAWQLLETDLMTELQAAGFEACQRILHAGGSLQVIQARKPLESTAPDPV